ncbi:hypothetical protein KDU71_11970 [Carboxylicivirga sediminis]|uniref:Peptidyl-prolyl cis-trans isomerase n=1 Tax=Carboxylicivirga sediminis TaxID=2006564 RepID=A0A941IY79_9BACT|nr:hypothetical protein [Carboxylicivirga sediminis]MBR8536278.1 hypothetical protein [Carboxylicivirga sediminis]
MNGKYSAAGLTAVLLVLVMAACNKSGSSINDDPLVRINEKVLTKGMIYQAIPNSLSKDDSTIFAQDYINRWIRSELLISKAELNLTPEEKDVAQLLEEYRRSLLIHQYQQKLLEQKYSPLITSSEIRNYYSDMEDNFKLADPIIKGVFVIVPQSAPNINSLNELYRSDDSEDLVKLEAYCFQNAKKYEVFLDHWLVIDDINKFLPEPISRVERFLRNNTYYHTTDSLYQYFLSIKEYKLNNELAPIEFVEGKIKAILLNKKRLEFIKQLESDLYEEALKNKSITFY